VHADKLQEVSTEMWEATRTTDMAAVIECLYETSRSGDKEQKLLVNLPMKSTPKMFTNVLAKKYNPRPKPKAVAVAGETARGKRKAADAHYTTVHEPTPTQLALQRAATLTRDLSLEGSELRQHEARKAKRAADGLLLNMALAPATGPTEAPTQTPTSAVTQPAAGQAQQTPTV